MVEEVKELRPKLEPQFIIGAEFRVLEHREVHVLFRILAKIRLRTRIIAASEGGGVGEWRGSEPFAQPLGSGSRSEIFAASPCHPAAASFWDTGTAKSIAASSNVEREAALERNDAVDSPPSDDLIGNRR